MSDNPIRYKEGFLGGTSANDMHPSAIIEGRSTTKGILIPRMTTVQRDAIVTPLKSLMVFNLTTTKFNFFNGTDWVEFGGGGDFIPLAGTEVGSPITGDLEFDAYIKMFWINGDYKQSIYNIDEYLVLKCLNTVSGELQSLELGPLGIAIQSTFNGSLGLFGNNDFTANYPTDGTEDVIFPQIKYVKDNFQKKLTAGTNISIVGGVISASGGGGSGTVSTVTATAPIIITSTPTTTPNVTIPQATNAVDGYLSATDRASFDSRLNPVNNLADVNSISTSRTNLGLGTLATQNGNFADKEDTANKQTDLTASATKFPTVNAVNTGLALKQNALGFTPYNATNPNGYQTSTQVQTIADAKVQNSLAPSTTIAPSATAVNNAINLLNVRRALAVDTGSNFTGTVTESIVSTVKISANSLDALCDLFYSFDYYKNTGNPFTFNLYVNTSNSLIGATKIGTYVAGSPRNGGFFRKMIVRGSVLDTQTSASIAQASNYPGDVILFAASQTVAFDRTVDNYLIMTVTLDNAASVLTTKRAVIEKLNLTF